MKYISSFLHWCFPPLCLTCDNAVWEWGNLCTGCWKNLTFIAKPSCAICSYPLRYDFGEGALCGKCIKSPPPFSRAHHLFYYKETGKSLIHKLKYGDQTYIARYASLWLHAKAKDFIKDIDFIVPVPMHRLRLLRRGFNQAALLGKHLSERTGKPFFPTALIRKKATRSQTSLTTLQRKANVQGAFAVCTTICPQIENARILLIDDVMTTGATIDACVHLLKKNGAQDVHVLTLARTIK